MLEAVKNTQFGLFMIALILIPPPSVAAAEATLGIKAVLFYPAFCAECPAVIDDFLLPLSARVGDRLALFPVDITEPPGDQIFAQALRQVGGRPDAGARPALLTGDTLLHGKTEIIQGLPPLLETEPHAAMTRWPDLPGLQILMLGEAGAGPGEADAAPDRIATTLAWSVMIGMLFSLGYAASRLSKTGRGLLDLPRLRSWSLPLFASIGLGIGVYLSFETLTNSQIMCGPIGDCMSVQRSPYAKLFGIPMAMWGVVYYLGILSLWLFQSHLMGARKPRITLGLIAFSLFGVAFSVYLTGLELFVIHAVCIWCLTSAVLASLILLTAILKTCGPAACAVDE
ncbi:MAG: vitamin K epoxide reductase family protein [Gammaproteobacteria bacterium]|nr:vitamin K epoxide reductase family protein [Gammaproteobacteria bacterium]